MRLFLRNENVITIVFDWVYDFPPTTLYYRRNEFSLEIEAYDFDYVDCQGRAFYKLYKTP